jgi:hypothetical protein
VETALYFPYVRVPQTPWFTQVLLYWDQAAAIVPRSLLGQRGSPHPYMTELVREGLLEYVDPDLELWRQSEMFDRAFLDLLARRPDTTPPPDTAFQRIHSGKLSWRLFDQLRERGLARDGGGPEWESWWQVERTTADAYMAYLASAISGARPNMVPVTDQPEAIATLDGGSGDFDQRLAALRYAVITQALPAPQAAVGAVELRAFKERHRDELRRCRLHLDGKLADLAALEDARLRQVKTTVLLQEIHDDVAELEEAMKKRRWPKVALVGFGGVVGAALATATVFATGGTALGVGLGLGAGVVQMAAAGQGAVDLVRTPRYNRRAPLAYAALAARL